MSDNLVPDILRAIRDDLRGDMVEVKERLGLIEAGYASLSRRGDRMAGDVEQIKRGLDIADASIG